MRAGHWLRSLFDHSAVRRIRRIRQCRRSRRTETLEDRTLLATFTVTNTNDSGPGSLREAMELANATTAFDRIHFNISGTSTHHTIVPTTPLPQVATRILFDATTQPGYPGTPLIEISGTNAGASANGFELVTGADASLIRGFTVNDFGGNGISLDSVSNVVIDGNFIGTDHSGTAVLGNRYGIYVTGASDGTVIGSGAFRNVISGNQQAGIWLYDYDTNASVSGTQISGNNIGVDLSGLIGLKTQQYGIRMQGGVVQTEIGGLDSDTRNIVGGHTRAGIHMEGIGYREGVEDVHIYGNYFGVGPDGISTTDSDGSAIESVTVSRAPSPVRVTIGTDGDGANDAVEGNVISGHNGDGAELYGSDIVVAGNMVGTDAEGMVAVPNTRHGMLLIVTGRVGTDGDGISDELEKNIFSGNGSYGLEASGSAGTIAGNFFGTDATGTYSIPNNSGVAIGYNIVFGGATSVFRNLASGNISTGLFAGGGTVYGNYIGTDILGQASIPNSVGISGSGGSGRPGLIGGALPGQGNLVSGNTHWGMIIGGLDVHVAGNFIGTDYTGEAALANGSGISFVPGGSSFLGTNGDGVDDEFEGNVIAGNTGIGLFTEGSTTDRSWGGTVNYIMGNRIGVSRSDRIIPNGSHGVEISDSRAYSDHPTVFGVNADGVSDELEANIVVGNGGNGIHVHRENVSVIGNYIGVLPSGIAAGNSGSGLRVYDSVVTVSTPAGDFGNRIEYNSAYGVEFVSGGLAGSGNQISGNVAGAFSSSQLNTNNRDRNYPVVTAMHSAAGVLTIEGFARSEQRIELYESGPTVDGFGEGRQLLVRLEEGSADDLDSGTGSYGPDVNGITVGSDTTNRFRFEVPLPAGLAEGMRIATLGMVESYSDMSVFSPAFAFGETGSSIPPAVELGSDVTLAPGESLERTGSFADPDSVTWTGTVDYGDGSGIQALPLGLFEFDLNHEYAAPGTYTVTVNITDNSFLTTSETMTVSVQNDAPETAFYTFDITSPITENDEAVLTGEFFDGLSSGDYVVDIDWGDGESSQVNLGSGDRDFSATHVYQDDSNPDGTPTAADVYEVVVSVSESGGAADTAPAGTLLAEVRNAIPYDLYADFSATTIQEGDSVLLDLYFTDNGLLDSHYVTIDWGDGFREEFDIPAGAQELTGLTHSYLDDPFGETDVFDVVIEVTDDDEPLNPATLSQQITVTNPAPENVAIVQETAGTIDENGFISIGGSFTDPGLLDAHLLVVDWGDGSGRTTFDLEEGVTSFSGLTHHYLDDPAAGSAFTITLSVADVDSPDNAGVGTLDVVVDNVAPVLDVPSLSSGTLLEGDTLEVVGSFTDAGSVDRHSISIAWGDGTSSPATIDPVARTFSAIHTYTDNGPLPIGARDVVVTLTDDDGGVDSHSTSINVGNVAPSVEFLPAEDNNDISQIDLLPVVFDPGTDDTFTYLWEASFSGTVVQTGTSAEFTLDRTGHLDKIFSVSLTVTDDDMDSGQFVMDVQVGTPNPETITLDDSSFSGTGDGILILALGGDDVVDASGVTDPNISLILDGGSGQDLLFGGAGNDIYILADGDDAANATPFNIPGTLPPGLTPNVAGDDTYFLTPNSTLTVFDDQGGNALDFSRGDFGITFDLEQTTVSGMTSQDVAPSGAEPNTHFVATEGAFNRLVGSTFGDTLTGANDSIVSSGAGPDELRIKSNTNNATFFAGADDDVLIADGSNITSLDFRGDDGLDTLINTGTITGLNFGGGADDDILLNNGTVLGSLDFNGDDGLDILTNTGAIALLEFGGGADDDIFFNNGPHTTTLDFGGDDDILVNGSGAITELNFNGDLGADIFANLGSIGSLDFAGGADDDIFVNNGPTTSSLDFGGDDEVLLNGTGTIVSLDFNGDDGFDTLQNLGTIETLDFNGGADDDILRNDGSVITSLDFGGDGGVDALLNTGDISTLTFDGGADDDIFLNNGSATTSLDFGGDDEILLNGTGTVAQLDFNGDNGADVLVNLNTITTLTFNGGADDDVLINNGTATTSLDFGGDDDILLNGTGTVTTLNFNGDDGVDTLINDGVVSGLMFDGGADDDILLNNGDGITSLNFNGDDGADSLINNGNNISTLDFNGDNGLDTFTNSGSIGTLNFGGGADDDVLINAAGGSISSLDFNGDEGIDVLISDGTVDSLNFDGGADDDILLNNGSVIVGLDFNGDDGLDTLINSADISTLNFDGGADDDILLNQSGSVTTLDFNGDTGNDILVNDATVGTLTFNGGADDDIFHNQTGSITDLDFRGDAGFDALINDGNTSTLEFTGGADSDRFVNRQHGLLAIQFYGGGSPAVPLSSGESDGDDLFVNFGTNIVGLNFVGDDGNDVFQNAGGSIQTLDFSGDDGNDVFLNSGDAVGAISFDGDNGDDVLLNSGDQITTLDFTGDGSVPGNDILILRGSGTGAAGSVVTFTAGNGTNLLHNFAAGFASVTFIGGDDADIFVNEVDAAQGLDFQAGDGANIFENAGDNFADFTFTGGADNDLLVNTGNDVSDLMFHSGAGDDAVVNQGDRVNGLQFTNTSGIARFENGGRDLTDSEVIAGTDAATVRNSGDGLTNFQFTGSPQGDTLINSGANADGITFHSGDGNDLFLNAGMNAAGITFNGGAGADGFQNGGNDSSGFTINGDTGEDTVINTASGVSLFNVSLGEGDDGFQNSGLNFTSSTISGDDGHDAFVIEGGADAVTINGDVGRDTLTLLNGPHGLVTFNAGDDDDTFENLSPSTTTLVINGQGGDDDFRNHGPVSALQFSGGDDNDMLTNTADVTSLTFHGDDGADTLVNRGNVSSLIADGGAGNDAFRLTQTTVTSANISSGAGRDSVEVESSGSSLTIDTGDDADSVSLLGDYSTANISTGEANDSLLLAGTGATTADGGIGSDTYFFVGAELSTVSVIENAEPGADISSDTLDFTAFSAGPISLDLRSTTAQTMSGLSLTLSDDTGIENVIGTIFGDTIDGNARDNFLSGADLTEAFDGAAAAARTDTQWVWLDFDTFTDAGEHEYSVAERSAVFDRLSEIYHGPDEANPWFDIQFTDDIDAIPVAEFVTVQINETPPSGRPGGLASEIDPGNRNPGGTAIVQISGMLGGVVSAADAIPNHDHADGDHDHDHGDHAGDEQATEELVSTEVIGALKPAGSSANFVQLTAKLVAHEVGHLLGLRHQDAFGPIGFGVNVTPGGASFTPAYAGPTSAFESSNHISSSPASLGTTRFDDLNNLYFGTREAIKLTAATTDPAAIHFEESTDAHQTLATADPLTPAVLDVPNTLNGSINQHDDFSVQYVSVRGQLEIDADTSVTQNDFYSFTGSAGDIVTIEVMSNSIAAFGSEPNDYIDSVLRLLDANGNLVPHFGGVAENDDSFEPTDSALVDVTLPADGTYFIEVDSFRRDPNDPLGDPTHPDSPLNPDNPNNILDHPDLVQRFLDSLNDTDIGQYELIVYAYRDTSGTDGINIIRGNGGTNTILGATDQDFTAPESSVDTLPEQATSLTFDIAVTGNDPEDGVATPSGVDSYAIYVAVDRGEFSLWQTVPADNPVATFTADSNHTYWFRSVATDVAGNVEDEPVVPDTHIIVGDLDSPETSVTGTSDVPSGLITINASGTDSGGGSLSTIEFFVSVDSGTTEQIGSVSPTDNGDGTFSASLTWQGIADGNEHTYAFYSIGIDSNDNTEPAPAAADITITRTFASNSLEATAIDVQRGANQRSFIRFLDVTFNTDDGVADLITNDRLRLERFDLDAISVDIGTGEAISIATPSSNGNTISIDFGTGGIGGDGRSTVGNGFYRISIDTNEDGIFSDQHFEFARILGDANGDADVTTEDLDLVLAQYGQSGENLDGDITGDGFVNVLDRVFVTRNYGVKLDEDLFAFLDD